MRRNAQWYRGLQTCRHFLGHNLSVFFREQRTRQMSSPVLVRSVPSQTLLAVDVWPVETGTPAISMHAGTTHRGPTAPPAPLLTPSLCRRPRLISSHQGGTRTQVGASGVWPHHSGAPLADPRQSPPALSIRGRGPPPALPLASGGGEPPVTRNGWPTPSWPPGAERHNWNPPTLFFWGTSRPTPSLLGLADGEKPVSNVASSLPDRCMTWLHN